MDEVARALGLHVGTFVLCLVSGFVPLVNAELYLIGLAVLAPSAGQLPAAATVTLAATGGQMLAKLVMYLGGRGVLSVPMRRPDSRLGALRDRLERQRARLPFVIFASASLGLPPLYLTSIVAGSMRLGLAGFLLVATAGRALRFGAVLLFPQLFR
jgi:membrane protein YqaA with SNARE-associated domain